MANTQKTKKKKTFHDNENDNRYCCLCNGSQQSCKSCICVKSEKPCTRCRKGAECNNKYNSMKNNRVDTSEIDVRNENYSEEIVNSENYDADAFDNGIANTQQVYGFIESFRKKSKYTEKNSWEKDCEAEEIEIEKDGNCLFRCFSLSLHGSQEKHSHIRKELCNYINDKAEYYDNYKDEVSMYEHLRKQEKLGTFGTQLELIAAADLYEKNIFVLKEENGRNQWHNYLISGCNHDKEFIAIRWYQDHFTLLKVNKRPCTCENVQADKVQRFQCEDKWFGKNLQEAEEWVNDLHLEISFWKQKDLFEPPKCGAGNKLIRLLAKQIQDYLSNTQRSRFAIKALMIIPTLMLQKEQKHQTTREKVRSLSRRMELLENGNLEQLKMEAIRIQKAQECRHSNKKNEGEDVKFGKLMKKGKVKPAIRMISTEKSKGPLDVNPEIRRVLKDKHPYGQEATIPQETKEPSTPNMPSIFEDIDCGIVWKKALQTQGSAGPSGLNADIFTILLSKRRFGRDAIDLQRAIALLARKLATEKCEHLDALIACRLIPLDKNPGIRPISIGEVLARVIGKCIMHVVKEDVKKAAGNLQVCAGHRAGGEAAIHAMRELFNEENTEAVILVDADNAFNSINRALMLQNIKRKCPTLFQYVENTYGSPANLYINGGKRSNNTNDTIKSEEGTRQGDPVAMGMYAIGLSELQASLAYHKTNVKSAAYADDYFGAGTIENIFKWWMELTKIGPSYGYHPNAKKTCIIVKEGLEERAKNMFKNTSIEITTEGNRHLGAVIGTKKYKEEYVEAKVSMWVKELKNLAKLAKTEPHSAYTAFTFGVKHKWTFLTRTVPDIGKLLEPLENTIRHTFIPAITKNRLCSDWERKLLALPTRLGGLGIIDPSSNTDFEFENSKTVTSSLTCFIVSQNNTGENDEDQINQATREIAAARQEKQEEELRELLESASPNMKRRILMTQEIGASNWLTSLPLKDKGFALNKQEFTDALALRYDWPIDGLPDLCACGKSFDANHSSICQKGGFIVFRHDEVRDITAEMVKQVCHDVHIEPSLQSLTGENFSHKTANSNSEARLDISARSFWTRNDRSFFDIRIFDPLAPSYEKTSLHAAYERNEKEKIRQYNERINRIEYGSFTPLVFSTFGGMSRQTKTFFKRLAEKMEAKSGEKIQIITAYLRCRLSFSLLRSFLLCLRGSRTSKPPALNHTDDFEHVVVRSAINKNID